MRKRCSRRRQRGQAVIEFALLYAGVILPLTFMIIFVAEMLWIWHGVVDFTRDGARFAATHCYQASGANVVAYMQTHVPAIIDQNRFQTGEVTITVEYFSLNADGTTAAFSPDACAGCMPDAVSVSIPNYQFLRFSGYFRLPPVTMPPFTTNLPMESGGFQDASGVCVEQ